MKFSLPEAIRCLRHAMVCILLAGVIGDAAAVTFTGTGGGPIPDNAPAAGVNTNFAVSGLTGQVNTVTISVDISHTWVGDLKATLIAPGGIAQLRLFGRVGRGVATDSGDSSNLGAVYTFDDNASLDLWTTVAGLDTSGVAPAGTYRTSTGGAAARSNIGGCSSFLNLAFGGLTAAQANGTWTLQVSDSASTDTGTVNAAGSTLNITTGPVVATGILFRSGFETGEVPAMENPGPIVASNVRGTCTPVVNSPTDSGLTDFVMVRAAAPPAITWKIKTNDGTAVGPVLPDITLGIDTDFFQMGDFDGDGISDLMVWRPGAEGTFFIRRSSRPNDVPLAIRLGTTGDVPDVSADFDGDHVTDAAVYRDGSPSNTTAHFYIRLSSTGIIRDIPVVNTDGGIAFVLKDVSGDGLADVSIQRNGGGGVGHFQFFNGSTGALVGAEFDFQMSSDFVMSGQYSGTALTDIIASRNVNPGTGTVKTFFPRDTGTGTAGAQFVNGISGDIICPGDYDGDGTLDIAIWRASVTPDTSKFIVRKSSNVAAPLDVLYGASGDYPVNNWDVH
jgi:subtilisin-like proprotein convertase family protein